MRIKCKNICLLFWSESKGICPQRAFCLRSRWKCTFTEITRLLPSDSDLKPFYSVTKDCSLNHKFRTYCVHELFWTKNKWCTQYSELDSGAGDVLSLLITFPCLSPVQASDCPAVTELASPGYCCSWRSTRAVTAASISALESRSELPERELSQARGVCHVSPQWHQSDTDTRDKHLA